MVDTDFGAHTGRFYQHGRALLVREFAVEDATNMYPGRVVQEGSTGHEVKVGASAARPKGVLGYDECNPNDRPATPETLYEAGAYAPVLEGGGYTAPLTLAKGFVAEADDKLFAWEDGQVVPGTYLNGVPAIKVPFVQKSDAVFDTAVILPAGLTIRGCGAIVTTAVASATIDIGIKSGETGGDDDGFADALDCGTAGLVIPGATVTAGTTETYYSANTVGAFLADYKVGANAAGDTGLFMPKPYVTDGTAKTLVYKTSASEKLAGYILLAIEAPGVVEVGVAKVKTDASAKALPVYALVTL